MKFQKDIHEVLSMLSIPSNGSGEPAVSLSKPGGSHDQETSQDQGSQDQVSQATGGRGSAADQLGSFEGKIIKSLEDEGHVSMAC